MNITHEDELEFGRNSLHKRIQNMEWMHKDVRTINALERIFDNLINIPIEELELIGDRYESRY